MKIKLLPLLVFILLIFSCDKDDDNNNNNYIPDIVFDTQNSIDTSLPQYNDLQFDGNHLVLNAFGYNAIVIYNVGNGNYVSFELTDPNHAPSNCSRLSVDGITASCNCDDNNSYNIVNGGAFDGTTGNFSLKQYFVEVNGSVIRVYNN
ncbi:hypothetical protein [Mesoflavibacter profundi]|uniref:Rieske domain-containing protein n=1 Tax=Mesoflavibacter profundi TaxID=2708110 RepID=A0ABT4S0X0_9FLAO|nr:hypothetical protein [Mesoflavibacter profundi]MDA0177691.1 hypothetical protein [Mesoflavibacter profundi]